MLFCNKQLKLFVLIYALYNFYLCPTCFALDRQNHSPLNGGPGYHPVAGAEFSLGNNLNRLPREILGVHCRFGGERNKN